MIASIFLPYTLFPILCHVLFLLSPLPKQHAAAAKSPQSCPTLCDPTDGSPPGSPIPGILQAIAFSAQMA